MGFQVCANGSSIAVMKIQHSVEAERAARAFVAGWPARLKEAGGLRVIAVPSPSVRNPEPRSSWDRRVPEALSSVQAGDVLLVGLPSHPVGFEVIWEIVKTWSDERNRNPSKEVPWAIAFDENDYPLRDLRFMWDRGNAVLGDSALALIILRYIAPLRRSLESWAPLRGESARLVSLLPGLPVVSAEILRSLTDPSGNLRVDRWSKRIAAMRAAGFLVPLGAAVARDAEVKEAHAEAIGRRIDRRPTRLYRSVLHDLREWVERRRAATEGRMVGSTGI